ncbi:hypothetical protein B7802_07465 [Salmonella enterica]|nr:hypothetical protein [Salmonella enterica]ECW0264957.1 hypothetical protein [Salmonella enterica subsp. diarizonae]EBD5983680.1 hypothetical protein [Salmonella enterica]EBI4324804.1 hypothetical protein [Salmonella enterica]ECO4385970.1 hypothetical protein [Salmonella enterica]
MKKFNEQERYYARKNRQLDLCEALNGSDSYTNKTADKLIEREDVTLSADAAEGLDSPDSNVSSWSLFDNASIQMPFGDLKEIIQRAYQSGVDKGREQGGLEPLFEGEV